ncbi:MAG: hypothetical protein E2604_17190, partial [Flavobacterium sp.]|nr:hypothetical protein [Flavobacterium sp.]
MKKLLLLLLLLGFSGIAQNSNSITLETPTAKPVIVTYEHLKTYTMHSLDSLRILNHILQYKSTLKNCKGVLLKELLSDVAFDTPSPKALAHAAQALVAELVADGTPEAQLVRERFVEHYR